MQYTDEETGITIRVYNSIYLDLGILITDLGGIELYNNPSALSSDCYGYHNEDAGGKECERGERQEWTNKEWSDCLRDEFDDLVDAYVGWNTLEE